MNMWGSPGDCLPPDHTPESETRHPRSATAPEEQLAAENVGLLTEPNPPSYEAIMRDRAE